MSTSAGSRTIAAAWRLLLAGWLAGLTGCALGPDFRTPEAPAGGGYLAGEDLRVTVAADGVAQRFDPERPVPWEWWREFGSAETDAAVERALAGSPSLAAAQATLRQSAELVAAGYGVFYPAIDAAGGPTRQRLSPLRFGQSGPGTVFNLHTASASVSWPLDLFGGARRALEGLEAQSEAQRTQVLAAHLALTANIVNTLIARAAYRERITALGRILAIEDEQIGIATAQFRGGIAAWSAVVSLQAQRAASESGLAPLALKRDQAAHLLAALSGGTARTVPLPDVVLAGFRLPEDLPASVPGELVRHRPDVLAAEAGAHAASAAIGVATANLFPSLSLSATYGTNALAPGGLFTPNSLFWSAGAQASAALFHGGAQWYQRKAAIDAFDAALAGYRQTVIGAFQQVADVMRALEHDAELVRADRVGFERAEEALALVQANYRGGIANYLQVLAADLALAQAQDALIVATAQRLQDTVALFAALGGGWWRAPPAALDRMLGQGEAAAGWAAGAATAEGSPR